MPSDTIEDTDRHKPEDLLWLVQSLRRADHSNAWSRIERDYMTRTGHPGRQDKVAYRVIWGLTTGYRNPPTLPANWPAADPAALTYGETAILDSYLEYCKKVPDTDKSRAARVAYLLGHRASDFGTIIAHHKGKGRAGFGF